MIELLTTTAIWSFSFSFIGKFLSGRVDPYLIAVIRLSLAFVVLAPFLKLKNCSKKDFFHLFFIGAVQIGLMSFFFYHSFLYLSVPEVVLFTVFTPLYVEIIGDIRVKKFNFIYFIQAFFSFLGAMIIQWKSPSSDFFKGFLLVQLCNICFALGQILCREKLQDLKRLKKIQKDSDIFGIFFLGGLFFSIILYCLLGNFSKIPQELSQYFVLIWLGLGASGIGYLLWNMGSQKVSHGTLASMNNLVVPLGIFIGFLFESREINYLTFISGSTAILFSVFFFGRKGKVLG